MRKQKRQYVGQFAPYYGPALYWNVPRYAPPAVYVAPHQLPAPPLPPCPPGYTWTPPYAYDNASCNAHGYFSGACCPSWKDYGPGIWKDSGFWGGSCPVNPFGDCVPPINVPPQYNPCQAGWNYNAQFKTCCPPGWKYDPYTEQCVPIGKP